MCSANLLAAGRSSRPSSSCGFAAAVGAAESTRVDQVLAHLDGPFERAAARRRRAQLLLAREAVELLEILQRVRLDARAQRVPHDRVQVDEQLGAQDRVELRLARRIAAGQPLERRRLVGAEVIDVHGAVRVEGGEDAIDDLLERALFLGRARRPERRVAAAHVADAEQILAAAVEREAVAFEIEEEIAARRLGQAQEAVLGVERQHLVLAPLPAARFQLDRGLVARALERFARAARRLRHALRDRRAARACRRRGACAAP